MKYLFSVNLLYSTSLYCHTVILSITVSCVVKCVNIDWDVRKGEYARYHKGTSNDGPCTAVESGVISKLPNKIKKRGNSLYIIMIIIKKNIITYSKYSFCICLQYQRQEECALILDALYICHFISVSDHQQTVKRPVVHWCRRMTSYGPLNVFLGANIPTHMNK